MKGCDAPPNGIVPKGCSRSVSSFEVAPDEYDLIVIGGGVQGIMLTLEGSRRGLRVLLLEKADWGSGTTYNWLRILHGGLRYLQTADLPRFIESVRERGWFLEHFPDLVAPLPCVMPLYRSGSRSPTLMAAALPTLLVSIDQTG